MSLPPPRFLATTQARLVAPVLLALTLFLLLLSGFAWHAHQHLTEAIEAERRDAASMAYLLDAHATLTTTHNRALALLNGADRNPADVYRQTGILLASLRGIQTDLRTRETELARSLPFYPAFRQELEAYLSHIASALELRVLSSERAAEALRLATQSVLRLHDILAPGIGTIQRGGSAKLLGHLESLAGSTLWFLAIALLVMLPITVVVALHTWNLSQAVLSPLNRILEQAALASGRIRPEQQDLIQAMPVLEQAVADLRAYRENRLKLLHLALDGAPVGVQIITADLVVDYVNDTYLREHHITREAVIGRPTPYQDKTHPGSRIFLEALKSGQSRRLQYRESESVWREAALSLLRDDAGQVSHAVLIETDISDQKRLERDLSRLANDDLLSGLSNRRHFFQRCGQEVERVKRYRETISLVLLDIDHFKAINDSYGHPAGDEVIRALGLACRQVIRSVDTAGRLGGEEFALLLPHTPLAAAREVAERLRQMAGESEVRTQAGVISYRISLGVAERRADEDPDALYARADEALYAAKRQGRDRTVLAT